MILLKFFSKDGNKLLGERELRVPLKGIIIGRSSTCDLKVDDPLVSRTHAVIYYKNKNYYIKDLESENGTFVNGKKISETIINSGDKIEIGNYNIIFEILSLENINFDPKVITLIFSSIVIIVIIVLMFTLNIKLPPNPQLSSQYKEKSLEKLNKMFFEEKSLDKNTMEEVIKDLQKAKSLNFQDTSIRENLICSYLLVDKYKEAKKELDELIKLEPNNKFIEILRNLMEEEPKE